MTPIRRRRILVVLAPEERFSAFHGGAVARGTWEVFRRLRDRYDVTVFGARAPGREYPELPVVHGESVRLGRGRWLRWALPFIYAAEAALRAGRSADAIVLRNDPFTPHVFRRLCPGQRLVVTLHHDYSQELPERILDRLFSSADLVAGVSPYVADSLARRRPGARGALRVAFHGVDAVKFRPRPIAAAPPRPAWPSPAGAASVLFVGRLTRVKGPHLLLEAMREVARLHPAARLVIAGGKRPGTDADNRYTRELRANAEPLAGRVSFTGYLHHDELPALYQACQVFVMPSVWQEAVGQALMEAMASGLPVVAARRGGIPWLVGDAGILVDPESPGQLAQAIARVLDDGALRAELGRRARARVEERYTWDRAAASMAAVLDEALAREAIASDA